MAQTARQEEQYSVEEYLAWERLAETKSEYYDGRIVAISGGSRRHSKIATQILIALDVRLRGTTCSPYNSDLKVRSGPTQIIYPDVTVLCDEDQSFDQEEEVVSNPIVVVEVLSPSTEAIDRGVKWMRLQRLPSLQHYVLISQNERRVELFSRDESSEWRHEILADGGLLTLTAISCEIPLQEIYDGAGL